MIRNENTNEDADTGEEVFKKTVTKIRKKTTFLNYLKLKILMNLGFLKNSLPIAI